MQIVYLVPGPMGSTSEGKAEVVRRGDMLKQVFASTSQVIRHQRQAIIISGIVTILAAIVGAVVSAIRAARTWPVEALRYE